MIKKSIVVLSVCLLAIAGSAWAQGLPDTGQTKCYDNATEIPCPPPGSDFYGQDAEYVKARSYTDLGNGIVRDNVTGLEWQQATAPGEKTWQNALAYCEALGLAGYTDWRLPTIQELSSLVDGSRTNPAIDPIFSAVGHAHWSSTTVASYTDDAWRLNFLYGNVYDNNKTDDAYVRAVRGKPLPANNFINNADGTITDTATGLMWQQATAPGMYIWQQALDYCANLELGPYSDWRLPDRNELQSLVDYSRYQPSINTTYFPDTKSYYWSSTTYASNAGYAWFVHFYYGDGEVNYSYKSDYTYVRAVRSGQYVLLGDLGSLCIEDYHCDEGETCVEGVCVCETNEDCDDGLFCTGVETCVHEECVAGTPPECSGDIPYCNEQIDQCVECLTAADCTDAYVCVNGECEFPPHPVIDTGDPAERACNPKSYTDLENGIVRDNVTGLEWQQATAPGTYTWQQALNYVAGMNAGTNENYGYTDWCLPTIEELSSLVDAGHGPAIDPIFSGTTTPSSQYWSSTTSASNTNFARSVGFNDGLVSGSHKPDSNYFRAMRSGQYGSFDNLVINGDGTVTDTDTGLMWQQCNYGQIWDGTACTGSAATRTWDQAFAYVQGLNDTHYLGYGDWRLPTRNELQSLIDYSREDPATTFPNTEGDSLYWSSTAYGATYGADIEYAWEVLSYEGGVLCVDRTYGNYVRAVRGGPCRSNGDWCIDDSDCLEDSYCDEDNNTCVECLEDSNCDDGEFCNGLETCVSGICVLSIDSCADNATHPFCDETADRCVECLADGDCDDYCVAKICVECRNNTDCSDAQFCTGTETCASGECIAGTAPCGGATPECNEATDRCVECLNDNNCPPGYRCTGNACAPRGTMQITKATVKAGKFRGADSMKFSGTLNATTADVNAAMNDMITLTIEAAGIPALDETTFTFPINATAFKKGKYKSPKVKPANKTDPVVGLAFDTIKGKLSFSSKNLNLTGLACPITVRIQFGNYAAVTILNENIVNGTKPCPSL